MGASDLEARRLFRWLTGLKHPSSCLFQSMDRLRRNTNLIPGSAGELIGRHAQVRRQCRGSVKEATLTVVVADPRSSRDLASVYPCASGTRGRSERSRARLSNCRGGVGRVEPGCPSGMRGPFAAADPHMSLVAKVGRLWSVTSTLVLDMRRGNGSPGSADRRIVQPEVPSTKDDTTCASSGAVVLLVGLVRVRCGPRA